jgi:DNA-binding NtrC family response regulator
MATARVLVVDDEKPILELATRALAAAGYEVSGASTAREALNIVHSGRPVDLVISDVMMPEIRGPELVTEIRQVSPSTRAVLMSGYVDSSALSRDIPFLAKPFSARDLVLAVERALAAAAEAGDDLRRARANMRILKGEARRMCDEIRETTERSKLLIEETRAQLQRDRKNLKK